MQDQDKEVQYAEIVKLFGFVLSQYRLYSDRHPSAQLAIRNFSARLEMVLNSEPNVTMAFGGGRLIINDHALDHKKVGVAELLRETHRLHVESLTFDRGANGEEIGSFFKLIALPARDIEALGGLKKRGLTNFGLIFTSVVFAAVHMNPIGFVPLIAAGMVMGGLYLKTGSLAAPPQQAAGVAQFYVRGGQAHLPPGFKLLWITEAAKTARSSR